jgi:hypothetical protein
VENVAQACSEYSSACGVNEQAVIKDCHAAVIVTVCFGIFYEFIPGKKQYAERDAYAAKPDDGFLHASVTI